MSPKTKQFLRTWVINTLAVALAVNIVKGIHSDKPLSWILAALLLGILNAFLRPFIMLLALPLLIFTLGLFMLVINALILYFVGILLHPHFYVDSFGSAILGALIIGIISVILNLMTGGGNTRVQFHRGPPNGPKPPDSGNGPVIDV